MKHGAEHNNVFPHEKTGLDLKYEKIERELAVKEQKLKDLEKELRAKYSDKSKDMTHDDNLPMIYTITPTYARPVQKAELTRLVHTFLHIKNLHWIVIEDSAWKTPLVTNLLANSGLKYTHLNEMTPADYKLEEKDPEWLKPRGVLQRNRGLQWLRENLDSSPIKGVVYFADDDNTYDLKLFNEV